MIALEAMSSAVSGRFRLYVLYAISFVSFFQADAIHASLNVLDVRFSSMLFSFLWLEVVVFFWMNRLNYTLGK